MEGSSPDTRPATGKPHLGAEETSGFGDTPRTKESLFDKLILKSLTLQNFRSYGETPTRVELGSGVLLFEGDIGSGKSSILYAIEFALFGLGESEAKHIVRVSAERARVELEFEVGDNEYKVLRTIERGKGSRTALIQTRGWLRENDGGQQEYSPTELKAKILEILDIKENPGRSSSRIFRFAVFAPQELMRDVLSQKRDERIDTLRRAFGIEDYSFASSNTQTILARLDKLSAVYAESSKGLDLKEEQVTHERDGLRSDESGLAVAQKSLNQIVADSSQAKSELEMLESERIRVTQLQAMIPQMEKVLNELGSRLDDTTSHREEILKKLAETEAVERTLPCLRRRYNELVRKRSEIRKLEPVVEEIHELEILVARQSESISNRRSRLTFELTTLESQQTKLVGELDSYARELQELPKLRERAKELAVETGALPRLQSELENVISETGAMRAVLRTQSVELERLRQSSTKLESLSKERLCPLCRQNLTEEHLQIVRSEFDTTIRSLEDKINEGEERESSFRRRLEVVERQREERLVSQKQLQSIEKKISTLDHVMVIQKETEGQLQDVVAKMEKLRYLLGSGDATREEQLELDTARKKLERKIQALQDYSSLKESVREFEEAGVEKAFLVAESSLATKRSLLKLLLECDAEISGMSTELEENRRDLNERKKELAGSEPTIFRYAKIKERVSKLEEASSQARERVVAFSTRANLKRIEVFRLTREVEELARSASMSSFYRGYLSWLENHFLPAIAGIERNVLSSINEEFNQVFQRWFSVLVEQGDLSVAVDDQFTPVVEQSGYELNISSLSGGERTAVALAYRLALNHMVKRANESIRTDLLVLDEPTEGFTREQIHRLGMVIEELDCDQIIVVSHETDLEVVADKVYRIEKVNGESVVTSAA